MKVMNKVNDGHLEELLTFKQVIRRGCLEQCGEHAYRCQGVKGKEYPWRKIKKQKRVLAHLKFQSLGMKTTEPL